MEHELMMLSSFGAPVISMSGADTTNSIDHHETFTPPTPFADSSIAAAFAPPPQSSGGGSSTAVGITSMRHEISTRNTYAFPPSQPMTSNTSEAAPMSDARAISGCRPQPALRITTTTTSIPADTSSPVDRTTTTSATAAASKTSPDSKNPPRTDAAGTGPGWTSSRYESQKRRDWRTFGQYLRNHRPPLALGRCSGAHVLEFLRYLDQFGKTKVHVGPGTCPFYGQPNPPGACACPLRQAWGSLDALVGRLRAAFEESGAARGRPECNPFGARAVRLYLREVREAQARARGIPYEKKKRRANAKRTAAGATSSSSANTGVPTATSKKTKKRKKIPRSSTDDEVGAGVAGPMTPAVVPRYNLSSTGHAEMYRMIRSASNIGTTSNHNVVSIQSTTTSAPMPEASNSCSHDDMMMGLYDPHHHHGLMMSNMESSSCAHDQYIMHHHPQHDDDNDEQVPIISSSNTSTYPRLSTYTASTYPSLSTMNASPYTTQPSQLVVMSNMINIASTNSPSTASTSNIGHDYLMNNDLHYDYHAHQAHQMYTLPHHQEQHRPYLYTSLCKSSSSSSSSNSSSIMNLSST